VSKRYRNSSVPKTKRTLVGYDKLNDVPVVIDTRVPDLSGSREPTIEVEDGDKYLWTCRFCQATTKVGRKVCSLCNKDASKVIKTVDDIEAREQHIKDCKCDGACIYEVHLDKDDVRDGQWKPNDRYDYIIIEAEKPQCIECFIILPLEFVSKGYRKCNDCRKEVV